MTVHPPQLTADFALRETLLRCFLDFTTSQGLSAWLRDLGQDPSGTVDEKISRVRAHTQYLAMPPADFPLQTLRYLDPLGAEQLGEISGELGLSVDGVKDDLYRRIYREVGFREGWLRRVDGSADLSRDTILPFVQWYPIRKRRNYERDYADEFDKEMLDIFGDGFVHPEYPVAHGSTLKIDFHLGRPQAPGVGVEFKRPVNNSELQRALGQMDQYAAAYGQSLVVVVMPDDLTKAQETLFVEALSTKGIEVVVKNPVQL